MFFFLKKKFWIFLCSGFCWCLWLLILGFWLCALEPLVSVFYCLFGCCIGYILPCISSNVYLWNVWWKSCELSSHLLCSVTRNIWGSTKFCGNIMLGIVVLVNDNIGMSKNEALVWWFGSLNCVLYSNQNSLWLASLQFLRNCLPDIISWNCFETYIPFLWRSSRSLSEFCMLGGLAFSYLIIAQGYFLLDKRVYIHVSKSSIWCFLSQRLILCDVLLPLSELIVYFLFSK